MGGEMAFEHENGLPIGSSQLPVYRNLLEDIKSATVHLSPPEPGSPSLEGVDLANYELSLDLGAPYYILFPKDPDTHKVLSRMHARHMPDSSKALIHPWLEKLSNSFSCFSLEYGDGYDGYGMEHELDDYNRYSDEDSYGSGRDYDEERGLDYTACSSSDCGMCGRCDY